MSCSARRAGRRQPAERAAGFAAGIAERPEGYATTAYLLAEQPQLPVVARGNLRAAIARSYLCDAAGHARALEPVWQIWCVDTPSEASVRSHCLRLVPQIR